MKSKLLLFTLLLSVALSAFGQGPATPDPYGHIKEFLANSFQIRVEVRFLQEKDDPVLAATINTGLRVLQNVVLVKDNPDLILVLMGKYTGRFYTCSFVVLNPANHTWANVVGAKVMVAMQAQGSKDGYLASILVRSPTPRSCHSCWYIRSALPERTCLSTGTATCRVSAGSPLLSVQRRDFR